MPPAHRAPFRSIFFSALAQGLQASDAPGVMTHAAWTRALEYALAKLYTYTRARPPSRTLIDPLAAFVNGAAQQDYRSAVSAAVAAANATKDMGARAGRSAYLEGDRLQREQVPDPGAWGVKVILGSLWESESEASS